MDNFSISFSLLPSSSRSSFKTHHCHDTVNRQASSNRLFIRLFLIVDANLNVAVFYVRIWKILFPYGPISWCTQKNSRLTTGYYEPKSRFRTKELFHGHWKILLIWKESTWTQTWDYRVHDCAYLLIHYLFLLITGFLTRNFFASYSHTISFPPNFSRNNDRGVMVMIMCYQTTYTLIIREPHPLDRACSLTNCSTTSNQLHCSDQLHRYLGNHF